MLANVDLALADARDAALTAEKDYLAALSALQTAEADLQEARQVIGRLQRLRDRLAGVTAEEA